MKLAVALRYAEEVRRRIKSVNGLYATPLCQRECVSIRAVWVFGSTVKGSQEPNDLDILIDCREVGRVKNWKQSSLDKRYLRNHGLRFPPGSTNDLLKWLTKGMKKVSRHLAHAEQGIDLRPMVMIYPRNDLPAYMAALEPSL